MLPSSTRSPLVEVLIVTYNHARYIEQAVRSVLNQQTEFPYLVVILDDFSTDGTRDILFRLREEHPDRIRLILEEQNRNNNDRFARTIEQSPAEYIAWLDGDDYWCSPEKLQKQIDFMKTHPDCSMSFHDVMVVYEDGSGKESHVQNGASQRSRLTFNDFWEANPIAGCSSVLRTSSIPRFPKWFDSMLWADWALCFLAAEHGDVLFMPDVLGVYRIHRSGLWTGMDKIRRAEENIRFLRILDDHWRGAYRRAVSTRMAKEFLRMTRHYEEAGQYEKAAWAIRQAALQLRHGASVSLSILLKSAVRMTLRRYGLSHRIRKVISISSVVIMASA